MTERKPAAARPKLTRRRDDDPVRIFNDFRVAWYPGGVPGRGNKRKVKRCKSREEAEAFALEKYEEIGRHRSRGPLSHVPLGQVWLRFVKFLRDTKTPQGTTDQYRSNWNCHMPEEVADVSCGDLDVSHWTRIFEEMLADGASQETMRAVARTLGALLTYAEDRNYFGDRDPFGVSSARRGKIVRGLANKAPAGSPDATIEIKHCPAPATIHRFAQTAELVLPGYGLLLVLLAFATGLRFTECLGLRVEHIDLSSGEIRLEHQLDRYQAWPAVAPPKGGGKRTVRIWASYLWVLQRLLEQAATHSGDHAGWLFPPDRQVKRWADRVNRLINQDAVARFNNQVWEEPDGTHLRDEWSWTFHWLRHAFASYSLAPPTQGGLGWSVAHVQGLLGHRKPSTTTDRYQGPIAGESQRAFDGSRNVPWDVPHSMSANANGAASDAA